MKKTFLEIFHKYHPDTYTEKLLLTITDIKLMADKELKIIEATVHFPQLVDKAELYRIQEEIRKAYDLNRVKLLPKYPAELFSADYVPQLLVETEEVGIVAKGFFHRYKYKLDQGVLTVELPVIDAGILLMEDARTPQIMENILFSEFGINIRVKIVHSEDFNENERSELYLRQLEELDKRLAKAAKEYDQAKAQGSFTSKAPDPQGIEQPALPRIRSVYDEDPTPIIIDGICTIGHTSYDISSVEYVIGDAFEIKPTPIAALDKPVRNAVILGEIYAFNKERNRTGEKFNLNYCITDGNSSIEIKLFNVEPEQSDEMCKVISNGAVVAMKGYAKYETKKNKDGSRTEGPDCLFYPNEIAKIKKLARKDNAPVKRVELHLHTQMSTMDAMIPPSVAVKQANKWGHPAVAITDHGNVQGYQDAMLTAEKIGQKVIYGMEAYFVNDTAGAVTGQCAYTPYDECIVFDIETTGLSAKTCKITEIGAVRIKQGEVLDTFNTFVNPEVPIPEEIVKLTGITDDMVKDAPKVKEALEAFFAFIGDVDGKPAKLLIAHNASFDIGFIRHFAQECGMALRNPYLDTVALSRFLNPSLNKHKLNLLAEHYNLGDFNHHRASDDAEMLAHIYFKMCEQMKSVEIMSFEQLCHEMTVSSDPLKLKPYHQILLVKNATG
jgi:DNA polymerase-3 subunit alpha (Gram-positive type)